MARFITVADITGTTVIQAHVNAQLLEPFIDVAQQLYVLRILGTPQYEALENDIISVGLSGLTGNNLSLLNKIKPALIYSTFYEAMPFLWARITNKGIVTKESDQQSTTVDEKAMVNLRANVSKWSEFYIEELKRFLRANKSIYTDWREEYFNDFELLSGATYNNGTTGYRSPIIFDRSLNHNNYYNYLKRFL